MMQQLMQMLADFASYMKADFEACETPNSQGDKQGCFNGEDSRAANERGVRPNADMSMICAFLNRYGREEGAVLPKGVSWDDIQQMARESLVFAYSTHKANKLTPCKNGQYWGSTAVGDSQWESSLWAMSVAFSAWMQRETLTDIQWENIYNLLRAECNYELQREIPTGYLGDTKAEENGWETNVLACALGLFPDDPLAPQWFERLRAFAINCYSHSSDSDNQTIIDPDIDSVTVADLYRGANLYDDYTLQNHNYFHTSSQNVVMQELGESLVALQLFQQGKESAWHTRALLHHQQEVMDSVLCQLALADGELAMPNGNDWSLFLYDQITSYSTVSCFLRDPYALLLEQQALQQIGKRQKTTTDGSWLLRPDVGARRMGVEAHRVMMTWLMHHLLPTDDITPATWNQFLSQYGETSYYPDQDVITASSAERFTCFSWSKGLKSYTGYFAPNNVVHNNIVVPFRANNTGNFIGWYEVAGKKTDATDVRHSIVWSDSNSYIISGTLETNEHTLRDHYLLFASHHNLVLYFDIVKAIADCTINSERGGLLAISTDPFTKVERTLATTNAQQTLNAQLSTINAPYINIDNCIGVLARTDRANNTMAFGDQQNNNSILTSRLYPIYSDKPQSVSIGDRVNSRLVAYYSNVSTSQLDALNSQCEVINNLPRGWKGYQVKDTDGATYLIIFNTVEPIVNKLKMDGLLQTYNPTLSIVVTLIDGKIEVLPIQ